MRKQKVGREFTDGDHESAYENPPTATGTRPPHFLALRPPDKGRRYALPNRPLISGPISAVLRYNCFPHILTFRSSRIVGVPLIGYFPDNGAMLPGALLRPGPSTFSIFCAKLAKILKMAKSLVGKALTFPGLYGESPSVAKIYYEFRYLLRMRLDGAL